jgi:hypothetical protein
MGKTVEGINTPDFQRNITTIAKELVTMERKALDDQVLFGTSPVMYREKRRLPRKEEAADAAQDEELPGEE